MGGSSSTVVVLCYGGEKRRKKIAWEGGGDMMKGDAERNSERNGRRVFVSLCDTHVKCPKNKNKNKTKNIFSFWKSSFPWCVHVDKVPDLSYFFTYIPAWSYPGKVQESKAKSDGTFHLWKWVQHRCEMSTISTPPSLPYITTPPQLLIATP